ncbi:MAG: translocation/assembly module TamB domain-containing protein [Bacteroidota bacterium]
MQTWLVGRITAFLSDEWGTPVRIGHVSFSPFNRLVLEEVYVEDLDGDTLAYLPVLDAGIRRISFAEQLVHIGDVRLEAPVIGIKRTVNPRGYNLDFLIDYFSGGGGGSKSTWTWSIRSVKLEQARLRYRDLKYADADRGIDWEDLSLSELDLQVDEVHPEASGALSFRITNMSFRERSGFDVTALTGDFSVLPDSMAVQDLNIVTDRSEIQTDIVFRYNGPDDFSEFIDSVRWSGSFIESRVDFRDLAYFAPEVEQVNHAIGFSGRFSGTVSRFKGKDVELRLTDSTYFKGDVSMRGLPDFDETYMEIAVKELAIDPRDVQTLPVYPFDSTQLIRLPQELLNLGSIRFNGRFNGFHHDFVAFGDIRTSAGMISTDLRLNIDPSDRNTRYMGDIRLFGFDAGRVWGLAPDVGTITMNAHVDGTGFELKNITTSVNAEILQVVYMGYPYRNIGLQGKLANRLFAGSLTANDPNLRLEFEGSIDLRQKAPVFDFLLNVEHAGLTELKLIDRPEPAALAMEAEIRLSGSTLDDINGSLHVSELTYQEGDRVIKSSSIMLDAEGDEIRDYSLRSDFLDLDLSGLIVTSELPSAIRSISARYLPALLELESRRQKPQDFTLFARFKNSRAITDLFFPSVTIAPMTELSGKFRTETGDVALQLKSAELIVAGARLEQVRLSSESQGDAFTFNTSVRSVGITDSVRLNAFSMEGYTSRDTAEAMIDFSGLDSSRSDVRFGVLAGFQQDGLTALRVRTEQLLLGGRVWMLDPQNRVLIDTTGMEFHDFVLRSGMQELAFSGFLSAHPESVFSVSFTEFESAQLNPYLSEYGVNIGGVVNGQAAFSGLLTRPAMDADINVRHMRWYGDTLGDADVVCEWDDQRKEIAIEAAVTRGGQQNIELIGAYRFLEPEDKIDFTIELKKTYLNAFAHYLDGIFSGLGGVASGKLVLKGPVSAPDLSGKVYLQKVGFIVDYTRCAYNFSSEVDILEDRFSMKDVVVNDANGNQAKANVIVFHDHLSDFRFDISIDAQKVQVLNTGPDDNSVYYGQGYASGNMSITGPPDYIAMNIGLKSEPGTRIRIPLSNPEEVSQSGFIRFTTPADSLVKVSEALPDLSGVELNMDLEVSSNAQIELIFDSKIGDVIKGSGNGNISLSVSPKEDLRMLGEFTIESGEYLFTMQNIINKNFILDKGGRINWSGDPYDASIDLSAVYRIRTGLYDLFQDSTYRTLVPVDLRLSLKDKLFNPVINFDIKVQNIDPNTENQVKRLINSEEEKYRQAVSLLVFRRFSAPAEIANRSNPTGANVVGVNAYEMLSNQLSNWASQISNQVNVGVNYRPGDAITNEELEVALSTSILNDRVTIDGNVGVANGAQGQGSQNTSNLVGDFNVEVKASKDGRVRLKAFNRSSNNSLINNLNSPYTQGVGVFYREEFDTVGELFRKYFSGNRKEKKGEKGEE